MSGSMRHSHIVDAIVVQHLQSHVRSRHSVAGRDFRVLLELVLKIHLYQPADDGNTDKNNPLHSYHSCSHNFLSLNCE